MTFEINHKESYSRGELLLRTFFGVIYIGIPHIFVMLFIALAAAFIRVLTFWVILFTGKHPESWFNFQLKLMKWSVRLNASLGNLIDGYPAIGLKGDHEDVKIEVPYPESMSRGNLILKTLFGAIYVLLPHQFCLAFRSLVGQFLSALAWWVVLFTGKYPASWHAFNVGTLRWGFRVNAYMNHLTDDYPPFNGRPAESNTGE